MNYSDDQDMQVVLPRPIAKLLKIIWIIFAIPVVIVLFIIMIGAGKEYIDSSIVHSDYVSATARLVEYTKCDKQGDFEWCYGVYEFNINDKKQQIVGISNYTKDNVPKEINIKYNENNPSEYIMINHGNNPLITVIVSLVIIICILFSIGKGTISYGKVSLTKF